VPAPPPPVLSYGVSIVRNTVIHADGIYGGGISIVNTWWAGPSPYNWPSMNNTLIFQNTLQDLSGPPPTGAPGPAQTTRIGINLEQPMVWNTVLYANTFNNVTTPLVDNGIGTITYTQPATTSVFQIGQ
jgi:hypothetical protein